MITQSITVLCVRSSEDFLHHSIFRFDWHWCILHVMTIGYNFPHKRTQLPWTLPNSNKCVFESLDKWNTKNRKETAHTLHLFIPWMNNCHKKYFELDRFTLNEKSTNNRENVLWVGCLFYFQSIKYELWPWTLRMLYKTKMKVIIC